MAPLWLLIGGTEKNHVTPQLEQLILAKIQFRIQNKRGVYC
jgi:hypothetical protein